MSEILVIAIVAVLVLKAEHWQALAHHLGRWLRYFRNLRLALETEMRSSQKIPPDSGSSHDSPPSS